MDQIEQQREREVEDPEYAAAEVKAFREQLEAETREQTIAAKKLIVPCVRLSVKRVWKTMMMTLMTMKMKAA